MTIRLRRRAAVLALASALVPGAGAFAQDAAGFPSRPMTLVVPYAAGGSSDTRARQIATRMAAILGKPVVVENRPGAAGNIGTDAIAKAAPDGHTFGIGNLAPLAVNKAMMPRMPFDPAIDLVPVVLIERGPLVLLVSQDKSGFKSLAELLAWGKSNPGKLSYASAGNGGSFHLAGELLEDASKQPLLHVPYRGGSAATTDMLAGNVSFMFDMVPAALPYLKGAAPKARALAVATDRRLPLLPEVPTFAELGIPGLEVSNWFGLVAPKGTPTALVARLNQVVNQILREPEMNERIAGQGNVVGGGTPQEFGAFIAAESARWSRVVRDKKIQAD